MHPFVMRPQVAEGIGPAVAKLALVSSRYVIQMRAYIRVQGSGLGFRVRVRVRVQGSC